MFIVRGKPFIKRQHVAAKGHLQIAEFVELIDDHFRNFAALQFDDDAHAIFIRFIAQDRKCR